jgi:thioredoxin-like negative regulator of GroEL
VIYDYQDSESEEIIQYEAEPQQGEGVLALPADEPQMARGDRELLDALLKPSRRSELVAAAEESIALGDRAFRERRYGDAVHFYAKAIEYKPDDAVIYLMLADALFATGDYHYCAYGLRRAFELDPTLAGDPIDKHEFYADPLEFDRQLAVLELYLEDNPSDHDARLVLAANYLFGMRPAAAVELLERDESRRTRDEVAGRAVLEAAKVLQYELASLKNSSTVEPAK